MPDSVNEPTPRRGRIPGWLGNLCLLVASVSLALVLGEIATRVFRPQQTRHVGRLYTAADTIGYVRLPNVHTRVNVGEGWVDLYTDEDGYRIGSAGRVEADHRVLILGDSFMEARGVEYEESVAGLLQAELPRLTGRRVAIRNNGVSGYSVMQYLMSARRAFARERFDAVLVSIYVGNDITASPIKRYHPMTFNGRPAPSHPKSWAPRDINHEVVLPLLLRLIQVSHLAALVWNETELLRARIGLAEWDFPDEFRRSKAAGPQWDITADLCAQIAALGESEHAKVLFVVIPQYAQMHPEAVPAYARSFGIDPADADVDQASRLLIAAMAAKGLNLVDALPALRAANHPDHPVFGEVDHHLSAAGHRVVAELVAPLLQAALGPASVSGPH
jgi:lysophospholipase L1-like esterase